MATLSLLCSFAVGLAILWLVCKLLMVPIKLIGRLVINAVVGALMLLVVNFVGGLIGLSIPITPISALITGVFGVPGVVLLLILQVLL
ncbi:MAG: pro-sigmaK processing inhibitor BofA family protein [Candidatus Pelethousia sp.]|nr:pro-sigmaK processing inhibitor BofA family protein [Candidatus Pelethousia sp.]